MAKFLLITHIYPPAIDGGSQIIYQLGQELVARGHQINVLTTNARSTDDFVTPNSAPAAHPPQIFSLSIHKHPHKLFRAITKIISPFPVLNPINHLSLLLQTGPIFKLYPLIRALFSLSQSPPNYIITGPLPTTTLLYAHFVKSIFQIINRKFVNLIVIPCFHHTDPSFNNPLLLKLLSASDYIGTLTDFENRHLTSLLPVPKPTIFTLGAGVDSSLIIRHKPSIPRQPHFVFLGNFAAHKGVITLLDAFNQLCAHHPSARLTLAGQSTLYYPRILAHFRTLPPAVRRQIKFIPRRYHTPLKIKLLDAATCLVLPSTQESFGLVIAEAWARGKPAIVANIPAPASLITLSQAGLTFPVGDSQAASRLMLDLCRQPSLARTLGQKGLNFVQKHHTWDKIGQCLLSKLGLSS